VSETISEVHLGSANGISSGTIVVEVFSISLPVQA